MPKNIKLLLVENVDNLGIVGDVVNVKPGYARNYLLPHGYATEPDESVIASLASKRAEAEQELRKLRASRESMIGKVAGVEITLVRSCNDQGVLYGSVTQQDIAEALTEAGFAVQPREVRLPHTIKRLGSYDVHIKVDSDLEADVSLVVEPDREVDQDESDEMEFDNEGNLIEKPKAGASAAQPAAEPAGE